MDAPRETIMRRRPICSPGRLRHHVLMILPARGLSKAAVYHYFPPRGALRRHRGRSAAAPARSRRRALPPDTESVGTRLHAAMRGHAEFFEKNFAEYVTLLHGFGGLNRVVSEDERGIRKRYETIFRSIVSKGVADGAIRTDDPAVIARGALSMLNWMTRWFDPNGKRRAVDSPTTFRSDGPWHPHAYPIAPGQVRRTDCRSISQPPFAALAPHPRTDADRRPGAAHCTFISTCQNRRRASAPSFEVPVCA